MKESPKKGGSFKGMSPKASGGHKGLSKGTPKGSGKPHGNGNPRGRAEMESGKGVEVYAEGSPRHECAEGD